MNTEKRILMSKDDASKSPPTEQHEKTSRPILIRGLAPDVYTRLVQVAASEERSIEGQVRYAIRVNVEPLPVRRGPQEAPLDATASYDDDFMNTSEARTALRLVSSAQERRDSIRRKLAQGSTAVCEADLKSREGRFAEAVAALHGVVPPLLLRHPACAGLDVDAEAVIHNWYGPTDPTAEVCGRRA